MDIRVQLKALHIPNGLVGSLWWDLNQGPHSLVILPLPHTRPLRNIFLEIQDGILSSALNINTLEREPGYSFLTAINFAIALIIKSSLQTYTESNSIPFCI